LSQNKKFAILSVNVLVHKADKLSTAKSIRVAILDDHQSIIDGYVYRLSKDSDIEVVATATYARDFEQLLSRNTVDVLILDVFVPTAPDNASPYPILHSIPKWLQQFPHLAVLVISMYNRRTLVKSVVEAGASGYILKDDKPVIQELGSVVRSIASGGVHFSQQAYRHLIKPLATEPLPSGRQLEALSLCAAHPEATTAELADMLGVAHSTLRNLLSGVYLRLNVRSRTAAVARARQLGLITPQEPTLDI
jgi:two-component system nitrate/nitrite response regulator NarL